MAGLGAFTVHTLRARFPFNLSNSCACYRSLAWLTLQVLTAMKSLNKGLTGNCDIVFYKEVVLFGCFICGKRSMHLGP